MIDQQKIDKLCRLALCDDTPESNSAWFKILELSRKHHQKLYIRCVDAGMSRIFDDYDRQIIERDATIAALRAKLEKDRDKIHKIINSKIV